MVSSDSRIAEEQNCHYDLQILLPSQLFPVFCILCADQRKHCHVDGANGGCDETYIKVCKAKFWRRTYTEGHFLSKWRRMIRRISSKEHYICAFSSSHKPFPVAVWLGGKKKKKNDPLLFVNKWLKKLVRKLSNSFSALLVLVINVKLASTWPAVRMGLNKLRRNTLPQAS